MGKIVRKDHFPRAISAAHCILVFSESLEAPDEVQSGPKFGEPVFHVIGKRVLGPKIEFFEVDTSRESSAMRCLSERLLYRPHIVGFAHKNIVNLRSFMALRP